MENIYYEKCQFEHQVGLSLRIYPKGVAYVDFPVGIYLTCNCNTVRSCSSYYPYTSEPWRRSQLLNGLSVSCIVCALSFLLTPQNLRISAFAFVPLAQTGLNTLPGRPSEHGGHFEAVG